MNEVTYSTPVGIIGLGIVGSRIATHLRKNGWTILGWNRTPKEEFPNDADSPSDLVQKAKVIALYLKNREACISVFYEMLPYLTPEHIIINHTTLDLATVKALDAQCSLRGATYWDAPFTGSRNPATEGQLAYYISGPLEKLPMIRTYLEGSSKAILEFGSQVGNATIVKLVTNLMSAVNAEAAAEALTIVKAYGMTVEDLLSALSVNACNSGVATFKLPFMDREDFDPHFSMDNMKKDSFYVQELAMDKGISTPAISVVSRRLAACSNEGKGDIDFSAIIKGLSTDQ